MTSLRRNRQSIVETWDVGRRARHRARADGLSLAGFSPPNAEHLAFQKLVSEIVEARDEILEVLTR